MQIKLSRIQQGLLTLLLVCSLTLVIIAGAGAESLAILQPAAGAPQSMQMEGSGQEVAEYVKRVGGVSFAADLLLPRSKETGKRMAPEASFLQRDLTVSFFSDREFHIQVDSQARPKEHILSLNGHLEGSELATFSLTVTPESYLIKLQNLDTATVYRVVGDTETGEGRVTEIDLREMPPMKHLPPLAPPEQ